MRYKRYFTVLFKLTHYISLKQLEESIEMQSCPDCKKTISPKDVKSQKR